MISAVHYWLVRLFMALVIAPIAAVVAGFAVFCYLVVCAFSEDECRKDRDFLKWLR